MFHDTFVFPDDNVPNPKQKNPLRPALSNRVKDVDKNERGKGLRFSIKSLLVVSPSLLFDFIMTG